MPCLTRRFAAPVVGHKVGCSMERRKANQSFDSAECRLRPLNQAENKLQKDRTSHIKTVNVYQRQNCTIDPFLPLLFEEPLRCGSLLQETCTKSPSPCSTVRQRRNLGGTSLVKMEGAHKCRLGLVVIFLLPPLLLLLLQEPVRRGCGGRGQQGVQRHRRWAVCLTLLTMYRRGETLM
ncbi:uncharacterized protein LOC142776932 [Rhipicephalus microplus]|uniref:uncharacterized protein LOC142776932 n=1 Tax=Rhipicephalus microplus TaxID=6941 RepID=UPI003F6A7E5B